MQWNIKYIYIKSGKCYRIVFSEPRVSLCGLCVAASNTRQPGISQNPFWVAALASVSASSVVGAVWASHYHTAAGSNRVAATLVDQTDRNEGENLSRQCRRDICVNDDDDDGWGPVGEEVKSHRWSRRESKNSIEHRASRYVGDNTQHRALVPVDRNKDIARRDARFTVCVCVNNSR